VFVWVGEWVKVSVYDHCVESGLINRQMQEVRGMRAVFVGIKSSVLTLCSWKAQ